MTPPPPEGATEMTKERKSWTLLEDCLDLKAGQVVYALEKYDYGSAKDDTRMLGEKCISVSQTSDGDYPFTTVPVRLLETRS